MYSGQWIVDSGRLSGTYCTVNIIWAHTKSGSLIFNNKIIILNTRKTVRSLDIKKYANKNFGLGIVIHTQTNAPVLAQICHNNESGRRLKRSSVFIYIVFMAVKKKIKNNVKTSPVALIMYEEQKYIIFERVPMRSDK